MVELRADDDDALAFGELIAFGFDPGNDLALGHGGAESRHEDLPNLQSNRRGCLESRSELESHRGGRRCERDAGRPAGGGGAMHERPVRGVGGGGGGVCLYLPCARENRGGRVL
jgi:hypothetical protein